MRKSHSERANQILLSAAALVVAASGAAQAVQVINPLTVTSSTGSYSSVSYGATPMSLIDSTHLSSGVAATAPQTFGPSVTFGNPGEAIDVPDQYPLSLFWSDGGDKANDHFSFYISTASAAPTLTFTLAQPADLTGIHYWNDMFVPQPVNDFDTGRLKYAWSTGVRGVKDVAFSFSTDNGATYSTPTSAVFNRHPTPEPYWIDAITYRGDDLSFGSTLTGVTNIKLALMSTYEGVTVGSVAGYLSLSQVRFLGDLGGPVVSPTWNVNGDGSWSVASNWTGGVPNSVGAVANFGTIITSAHTVTVDSTPTVGTMNFSGTSSYTLAGANAITMDVASGQAAINVTAGSHTISAPVTLNDDATITSAASTGVALTDALTATGKTITKAGVGSVQFQNVRAAALNVTAGSAQIGAQATANSAAGTSVVNTLTIASGATLDVTNNSLIIDYSSVGTLVSDTRQMIAGGKLITSSGDASKKLGYGDNAVLAKGSFGGQSPDATSMLVKFTYGGDANLDGQVDISDLGALATAWQTSAPWTGGDFNYDAFVDISDLGILATNWQLGVSSPLGPSFDEALASVGLAGVSVPEPTSLGLIGLCLAGVAWRRRRNLFLLRRGGPSNRGPPRSGGTGKRCNKGRGGGIMCAMKLNKRIPQAALGAAVLISAASATRGAAVSWINTGGGSWGAAANWSSNPGLPTKDDDVTIGLNTASYTVNYDTDVYSGASPNNGIRSVTLSNNSSLKTLTLNISAAHFAVGSGNLYVNKYATASVFSGGVLTVASTLTVHDGDQATGVGGGVLTLAAGGSIAETLTNSGGIGIGGDTAGTFSMTGGTVTCSGWDANGRGISVGTTGSGSSLFGGKAYISGGTITNEGRVLVGSYNNATSTAARPARGEISLSGGQWTNGGHVVLGFNNAIQTSSPALGDATGTLNISGGTFTIASTLYYAPYTSAHPPARPGKLFVGGSAATGVLNVSAGSLGTASVPVSEMLIGTTFDYAANTISGVNGTHIGEAGQGIFNLSGGNLFATQLTAANGTKSKVNFTGGTLNTAATNFAGVNGAGGTGFIVGNGTLVAKLNLFGSVGGTHTFAGGLTISNSASLVGRGTINGNVVVNSGGSVGRDDAFGKITANDNFTLSSSATLNVELGAPTSAGTTYDQIALTGTSKTFTVGGATLQIIPMSGIVTGTPYRIVDATGGSGNTVDSGSFFSGLAKIGTNSGSWVGSTYSYNFDVGSNYIDVTFQTVPEPTSAGLAVVTGMLGMACRRRRGV